MEIIDAHHHLWDRSRFEYGWLRTLPDLDRNFLIQDFEKVSQASQVVKSVFVQADVDPPFGLQEARWALSLAADQGPVAGVVAWAPVEADDLGKYLDRLGDDPYLKGVRRLIQGEADDFCRQPAFVAGVKRLAARGLSFDLCVYHPQLPAVEALVGQVPEGAFVLDHLGKPDIKGGRLDPWRQHIQALAAHPNVCCKVSGMVTEADPQAWTAAQLQPYIDHVVEAFGVDRLMFGSDWPVSTLGVRYEQWVEVVRQALSGCGAEALQQVFYGNAARFYRLAD